MVDLRDGRQATAPGHRPLGPHGGQPAGAESKCAADRPGLSWVVDFLRSIKLSPFRCERAPPAAMLAGIPIEIRRDVDRVSFDHLGVRSP